MGDKEWVDFLRAVLKDFTEIEYRPVGAPGPSGELGISWLCRHRVLRGGRARCRGARSCCGPRRRGRPLPPLVCRVAGARLWVQEAVEGAAGSVRTPCTGAAGGGCVGARRTLRSRLGDGAPPRGVLTARGPQVAMQSLWNIKVVVLVKPEHENRISHVSTSSVKTGIANTLGRRRGVRLGVCPCVARRTCALLLGARVPCTGWGGAPGVCGCTGRALGTCVA